MSIRYPGPKQPGKAWNKTWEDRDKTVSALRAGHRALRKNRNEEGLRLIIQKTEIEKSKVDTARREAH